MPRYRVTKPCFYEGCFREPGGKHSIVVAEKPLKKLPSYLELIDESEPAKKAGKKAEKDGPLLSEVKLAGGDPVLPDETEEESDAI